jgi:mRNA interferase MazF
MTAGEIYLANFPFGEGGDGKIRPVLLLTGPIGSVPELLVAYVSSVLPPQLLPTDIILDPHAADHASTKLKAVSVLRLHKLATIHRKSVVRLLGAISATTQSDVEAKLRALLRL